MSSLAWNVVPATAHLQEIATFQMTEEQRIFDEVVALIPRDSQKTLKVLFEGVWERS